MLEKGTAQTAVGASGGWAATPAGRAAVPPTPAGRAPVVPVPVPVPTAPPLPACADWHEHPPHLMCHAVLTLFHSKTTHRRCYLKPLMKPACKINHQCNVKESAVASYGTYDVQPERPAATDLYLRACRCRRQCQQSHRCLRRGCWWSCNRMDLRITGRRAETAGHYSPQM